MVKRNSKLETLTRAGLLAKYGISFDTLGTLLGSDLLEGEFDHKAGKSLFAVSPQDDFVFRCSRLQIDSFHAIGLTLPFHRFLIYRFINTPVDEVYEEIFQLGLLPKMKAFTKSSMNHLYRRFIGAAPRELVKAFKDLREPRKAEKKKYDLFLKALNLQAYYDRPSLVDDLMFYVPMRLELEALLTTICTADEAADAISKMIDVTVPLSAITAYRVLFYASHNIDSAHIDMYHSLILPSERLIKREAAGLTLTEFCVKMGADRVVDTKTALEVILKHAQKEVMRLQQIKTPEGQQAARAALDRLVKAHDRLEGMGATSEESRESLARTFKRFNIKKVTNADVGPILTIHDIQKDGVGEVESGGK